MFVLAWLLLKFWTRYSLDNDLGLSLKSLDGGVAVDLLL